MGQHYIHNSSTDAFKHQWSILLWKINKTEVEKKRITTKKVTVQWIIFTSLSHINKAMQKKQQGFTQESLSYT